MNTRKMTPENKKDALLLFKQSIPVKIIANLLDVNQNTLRDCLPQEEKDMSNDFKEPSPEKKLGLLKLYAWLLVDENDCALSIGTPLIIAAAKPLHHYLNLGIWQEFLEGMIAYKNVSEVNRFSDDVIEPQRKLINEIIPFERFTKHGKDLLREVLLEMHAGTLPFPDLKDLRIPHKILTTFIAQKFLPVFPQSRFFEGEFMLHLESLMDEVLSPRAVTIIKSNFGLDEITLPELCEKLEITHTRGKQLLEHAVKGIQNTLKRRYQKVIEKIPIEYIKVEQKLVEKQKEIDTLRTEFISKQRITEGSLANAKRDIQTLIKHVEGAELLTPQELKSIKGVQEEVEKKTEGSLEDLLLKISFEDLDLSVRAFNCIKAARISDVTELVQYEFEDLARFRNFGQKSLTEIEQALQDRGLSFGMKISS